MHSKLSAISMLAAAGLLAACSGAAAPSAAPTATATLAASSAPTASPTLAPTAPPTVTPTEAATPTPTATPTSAPSAAPTATGEAAFPNDSEALLVSYVLADYQDTCGRYPPTYDTELASISCGPDDLLFEFTLFGDQADMAAAYNGDLHLGDFPPAQDGRCKDANYEAAYTIDGTEAGRINCRQHTSSGTGSLYHVIEWTNDELLVIGYVSNRADLRSWDDLIDFWSNKAGPFKP